ncbi:MAG: hypothetical protein R3Y16_02985 [Rikenellaceae bacterium]
MKDFDIEKIGKKMPYSAPSTDYFEDFTKRTLERIENEKLRESALKELETEANSPVRVILRRVMISAAAVAAAILVGVTLFMPEASNTSINDFDTNLDMYVEMLSDEELSTLFYEMEVEGEFYSNL